MTSQTNLTSDTRSDINTGHRTCSTANQYTLPKPTWPATLELRGGYSEDPMFIDWGFLHPTVQLSTSTSPRYSPNSVNIGSWKNSGRISELNSLQNSSNASRNNLNSEVSESDHSAPSSPATSSHDNSSPSLSEPTVSPMQVSQIQCVKSSSEGSIKIGDNEHITAVTIETFGDNSVDTEEIEERQDTLENVIQTLSKSADELEAKNKEESKTILGIYDSYIDAADNCPEGELSIDMDIDTIPEMFKKPKCDILSSISLLKSKMSLPLVKVSDKSYTYLRPRSKTFSHLNKSSSIDGQALMEKLNDIVKEGNISPCGKES